MWKPYSAIWFGRHIPMASKPCSTQYRSRSSRVGGVVSTQAGRTRLRQVIHALEIDPVGDHQVTLGEQVFQGSLGWLPIPPAAAFGTIVFKIRRPQGPSCRMRSSTMGTSSWSTSMSSICGIPLEQRFSSRSLSLRQLVAVILQRDDRCHALHAFKQHSIFG